MRFAASLFLLCIAAAAAAEPKEPSLRGSQVAAVPAVIIPTSTVSTTTLAVVAAAPVVAAPVAAVPATGTTTTLLEPITSGVTSLVSPFTSLLTMPLGMISPVVSPISSTVTSLVPTAVPSVTTPNVTALTAGVVPVSLTGGAPTLGLTAGVMPGAPLASVQAAFTDMRFTPGPLAFLPNADAGLRQYLRITPSGSLPLPLPAGAVPPPLAPFP